MKRQILKIERADPFTETATVPQATLLQRVRAWRIEKGQVSGQPILVTESRLVLAKFTLASTEEDRATVAAAPDLLAVAKLALSRASCELRMWPRKEEGSVEHQSLTTFANKLRAAIHKAEGAQ